MALERKLSTAIEQQDISAIWDCYQEMAWATDKHHYEESGLLKKAKEAHVELGKIHGQSYCRDLGETFTRVKESRLSNQKWSNQALVLASSPEVGAPKTAFDGFPILTIAIWAIRAIGGDNIAGDADDIFHKRLMSKSEMDDKIKGWRIAWKGKLEGALSCCKEKVILFSIAGGPETQWERNYLMNELPKGHEGRQIDVVNCNDLHDFFDQMLKLFDMVCPLELGQRDASFRQAKLEAQFQACVACAANFKHLQDKVHEAFFLSLHAWHQRSRAAAELFGDESRGALDETQVAAATNAGVQHAWKKYATDWRASEGSVFGRLAQPTERAGRALRTRERAGSFVNAFVEWADAEMQAALPLGKACDVAQVWLRDQVGEDLPALVVHSNKERKSHVEFKEQGKEAPRWVRAGGQLGSKITTVCSLVGGTALVDKVRGAATGQEEFGLGFESDCGASGLFTRYWCQILDQIEKQVLDKYVGSVVSEAKNLLDKRQSALQEALSSGTTRVETCEQEIATPGSVAGADMASDGAECVPAPAESDVDMVVAMGFAEDRAREALQASRGDVDGAVELLVEGTSLLMASSSLQDLD